LIWFLQDIYRLDAIEAHDAVCDRKLDRGIDALAVDDGQEEIVLFQAKRAESLPSTLGDKDLKQFVGALAQFRTEESVSELVSTTKNDDLRRLLKEHRVAEKIAKGYKLHPIFVANLAANSDAHDYIRHAARSGDQIDLWDLPRITPVLNQLSQEWFVADEATLRTDAKRAFHDGQQSTPDLLIAAIRARELVKLPGISDTRIFAQNVRLGLGNTRVNMELGRTIQDPQEHSHFITFHNGLTIVARELEVSGGRITMRHYSVCNGCQSLLAFHRNQSLLTNKLLVLVRIVRIGTDRSLAASIAYKTNNQNPISLRDLSANNAPQVQLKAEFDNLYGYDSTYVIKRGVPAPNEEFHNETAGQMLLALYVRQPWNAHQKYKVFGELESEIFRYGISAAHIRFAQQAMRVCTKVVKRCTHPRISTYGLTRFLLLYLMGELLRKTPHGTALLDDPKPYLATKQSKTTARKTEADVITEIEKLVTYAITELNYYVDDRGGEAYDYKSEFKTPKGVEAIRSEVLKSYDKDLYRDKVDKFELPRIKRAPR